jgi:hypothetical protein
MTTYGPCLHRPPSPGQSMCSCDHSRRELEFVAAIVERSRAEAVVTIPLPWIKPPLTGNRTRGNPYARANEVRDAKAVARLTIGAHSVKPLVGANITLHMRMGDRRRRDADGLAPTLKVCLDALVAEGVLPDDSWVHVPRATCEIHPPNGEPAAMWLTLEPLETP